MTCYLTSLLIILFNFEYNHIYYLNPLSKDLEANIQPIVVVHSNRSISRIHDREKPMLPSWWKPLYTDRQIAK